MERKIIAGMKLLKEGCEENSTFSISCIKCPMVDYCGIFNLAEAELPEDFDIPESDIYI